MEDIFPVKLPLRIDWSEMDLFGHVNNVSFMKYVQAARVNYWEQIGLYSHFAATNIGPMLASTACQFKKPLFYPGNIMVQSRMAFIKTSSFGIHHQILDSDGAIAATAEDVMVLYDFTKNEKVTFPDTLRKTVETLEGRGF